MDDATQVQWKAPMSREPVVGIIGGGVAGLSCARELAVHGIRSHVWDTGRLGCGGRMATRSSRDGSLSFDHGSQFLSSTDPRFDATLRQWEEEGAIRAWEGPVGRLNRGVFEASEGKKRYVGAGAWGMRGVVRHLEVQLPTGLVEITRPLWVAKMVPEVTGWKLSGKNKELGMFDVVVIAHNGKCANNLVGDCGAAPRVARQLMGLRLSATWVCMLAFAEPLPGVALSFEGAAVEGSPELSWVANNTKKLRLVHHHPGVSCWTLSSTNAYAQKNKVPQEAIPDDVQEKITGEMLRAFERALDVPLPKPVLGSRCQLWGAALPLNSPGVDCIFDSEARVGVAGDWCSGAKVQHAALSGVELARRIVGLRDGARASELNIGLTEPFRLLDPE